MKIVFTREYIIIVVEVIFLQSIVQHIEIISI